MSAAVIERAPVRAPTVPLVQFTDKRTDSYFVVYEMDAGRYRSEWWAIDEKPWTEETGVELSDDTLRGNARRLLGPVLRGDVYCSPWCGAKCKKAAYDRCVREADLLAKSLGDGWEPRVWENMGWFYEASKGHARVTPNKSGSTLNGTFTVEGYTAWLNFGDKQVIERGSTPQLALAEARLVMNTVITTLTQKLAEVFE